MLFTLKFLFFVIFAAAGALSILVAYKEWRFIQRLVLGKEGLKKRSKNSVTFIFYMIGFGCLLLALLILTNLF